MYGLPFLPLVIVLVALRGITTTNVILATGIPQERCERINLGYRDPAMIDPSEWEGREDEGILQVRNAGEVLYRLK